VLLIALDASLPRDARRYAEAVRQIQGEFIESVDALGFDEWLRIFAQRDAQLRVLGDLIPALKTAMRHVLGPEE
jgi:hypothetical protein